LSQLIAGLLRLAMPVVWLAAAYAIAAATVHTPVAALDPFVEGPPSRWLTIAHLTIMLGYFVSMLNNRARGPAFAFAQLVATWLVAGSAILYLATHPVAGLSTPDATQLCDAAPLLGALFASHIINILVYDRMRGIPWWRAPLAGGLAAAIALPALTWPFAASTQEPWITQMTLDIGLKVLVTLALLIPFAVLRSATRPRNGFGGY